MGLFGKKKKKEDVESKNIAPIIPEEGQLSQYDELTGVLSVASFNEEAAGYIRTFVGSPIAFCYISVGNIGAINEKYGMEGGNDVLRETARVLTSYDNGLLVTRDLHHFMFMTSYQDEKQLGDWLDKLHEVLSGVGRVLPENPKVYMHTGVYVTGGRLVDLTAHEMLERAFLANREAAKRTHSSYIFYSEQLRIAAEEEKELEKDMEAALENNEFLIYIQPRFDIHTNKIIGGKIFSRWNHPKRGLVAAHRYIPMFVKNGFIIKLDIYMLEKTCMLIRKWLDKGYKPLRLSLNVPRVFVTESEKYVPLYKEIKKKYDIPDGIIELEFSERLVDDRFSKAKEIIKEVADSGFLCAVENYGSGLMQPETITDTGIHTVKLSRDLFEDKFIDEEEHALIDAAVQTAHDINVTVAATGVPDNLIDELRELNCDIIQGRLGQEPMSLDEFTPYVTGE